MAVTASTNYSTNKGSIANILDGNRNTYWSAAEGQSSGKYIMFSFSDPVIFRGITAVSGSANGTQILAGSSLEVSIDGRSWQKAGEFDGSKTTVIGGLNFQHVVAVRILWNGRSQKKLTFYEAELDFMEESSIGYIKKNSTWLPIKNIYRKENGRWDLITNSSELFNTKLINRST